MKIHMRLWNKLDDENTPFKDWRRIAEYLNMTQAEIATISHTRMPTAKVLFEMSYRALKVSDLVRILMDIGRHDCVSLLEEEGVDLVPNGISKFYLVSFLCLSDCIIEY